MNINGAINIETLEPTTGFYDTINAEATIDLFSKIEAKHPEAESIYIIVDNARYYRSRLLQEALEGTKIKLLFLPAYSPNLNLIERYWKFFKKMYDYAWRLAHYFYPPRMSFGLYLLNPTTNAEMYVIG